MSFLYRHLVRKSRHTVNVKGSGFELLFATAHAELVPLLEARRPELVERSGVSAVLARHALHLVKTGKLTFLVQGDIGHFGTQLDTALLDEYLEQPEPSAQAQELAERDLERYFREMDYGLSLTHLQTLVLPLNLSSGITGRRDFCCSCGVPTRFEMSQRADALFERMTLILSDDGPKACFDSKVPVEADVTFGTGEIFVGDWLRHEDVSVIAAI